MRTIDVFANPYCAVDKDGCPQGTVGYPGMPNSKIGAQADLVASNESGRARFYFPLGKTGGKCRVPYHPDIVTSVQCGELIVASKEDAAICGITTDFLEPEKALAAEKTKALRLRQAERGSDATLAEIPRQPKDADPAIAPKGDGTSARVSANLTLTKSKES